MQDLLISTFSNQMLFYSQVHFKNQYLKIGGMIKGKASGAELADLNVNWSSGHRMFKVCFSIRSFITYNAFPGDPFSAGPFLSVGFFD